MSRKQEYTFVGVSAVMALVAIAFAAYGYIENIIHLVASPLAATTLCALRLIGIFMPPLGIFMGWFF